MRLALILSLVLSPLSALAQAPAPAPAGFVGNAASKVFHRPSCKLLLKTKPGEKVTFATRDEALKAGFAPCKLCQP